MARTSNSRTEHPFKAWLRQHGMNAVTVAKLAAVYGQEMSDSYVRHIASGYRIPSWGLARALSKVTNGEITADQFMDFKRSAKLVTR